MALSGLDIYKLLPKTNCRECGFVTCLAFAMQLAKKAVSIEKCPYLSPESKEVLEESGQPPIKLISLGTGEKKMDLGNETVMFRHEEKFRNPAAIGFIIDDSLTDEETGKKVGEINKLAFERVGQKLDVPLIALRQNSTKENFIKVLKKILSSTDLGIALMTKDTPTLEEALLLSKDRKPLVYDLSGKHQECAKLCSKFQASMVVSGDSLEAIGKLTKEINSLGVTELVLDIGKKPLKDKLWDITQIRRMALKKSNRSFGYPVLVGAENVDPYKEAAEAATFISKYASIVLLSGHKTWEILSLLTLRQNIYTDPQKPLQIEPGLYPIGECNEKSDCLITTNFSLSYYTVLGEVEASKIPTYILSVDTEGMSVLTAWAAEKFTPSKISESINKFGVKDKVRLNRVIIPGYVAVLSGDLEEQAGLKVVVGPKEAAGIPSFLKNL